MQYGIINYSHTCALYRWDLFTLQLEASAFWPPSPILPDPFPRLWQPPVSSQIYEFNFFIFHITGWAKVGLLLFIWKIIQELINNTRINCCTYNCKPTFVHPISQIIQRLFLFLSDLFCSAQCPQGPSILFQKADLLLSRGWRAPLCPCLITHPSSTGEHLACLYALAAGNNVAIIMGCTYLFEIVISFLSD